MNRRRFLSSAFKTASAAWCAPLFTHAPGPPLADRDFRLAPSSNAERPQVALTMDDPRLKLDSNLQWPDANSRLLKALAARSVQAALFVCGMRVDEPEGAKLISAWDQAGHLIGNHSYSHLNYCGPTTSYSDFAVDFLKNERIVAPYRHRTPLFRYPFLKEGDTTEKRDRFRALLKENGYRVGHVTIDASDWYVNERLMHRWDKQPKAVADPYREYLTTHLLDRAKFYRQLAIDVLGRDVRHTLLVHYNTLNALVLPEVMSAFESTGWQWIDASLAYQDEVFRRQPQILPAGESLLWALAAENGRFKDRLRYPGEDGDYEQSKMDALGL